MVRSVKNKIQQENRVSRLAGAVDRVTSTEKKEMYLDDVMLKQIDMWHGQPRTLHINVDDVIAGGVTKDDPDRAIKQEEMESLIELANSIHSGGLINPLIGYRESNGRTALLGGHRRFLAKIYSTLHLSEDSAKALAENKQAAIDAAMRDRVFVRLYDGEMDSYKRLVIAMSDNANRQDISVKDKLRTILMIDEAKQSNVGHHLTAGEVGGVLGAGQASSYNWMGVIKQKEALWVKDAIDLILNSIDEKYSIKNLFALAKADPADREALFHKSFMPKTHAEPRTFSIKIKAPQSDVKSFVLGVCDPAVREDMEKLDWDSPKAAEKALLYLITAWNENNGKA